MKISNPKLRIGDREFKITPAELSYADSRTADVYLHSASLLLALMKLKPKISWRTRKHNDGESTSPFFAAGLALPTGQIVYSVPDTMWRLLDDCEVRTIDKVPADVEIEDEDKILIEWILQL